MTLKTVEMELQNRIRLSELSVRDLTVLKENVTSEFNERIRVSKLAALEGVNATLNSSSNRTRNRTESDKHYPEAIRCFKDAEELLSSTAQVARESVEKCEQTTIGPFLETIDGNIKEHKRKLAVLYKIIPDCALNYTGGKVVGPLDNFYGPLGDNPILAGCISKKTIDVVYNNIISYESIDITDRLKTARVCLGKTANQFRTRAMIIVNDARRCKAKALRRV